MENVLEKIFNSENRVKTLIIYNKEGITLTTKGADIFLKENRYGKSLKIIARVAREAFDSELRQIKINGHIILTKNSENFMGCLVLDELKVANTRNLEKRLDGLLCYLENKSPRIEDECLNFGDIENFINQFSTRFE